MDAKGIGRCSIGVNGTYYGMDFPMEVYNDAHIGASLRAASKEGLRHWRASVPAGGTLGIIPARYAQEWREEKCGEANP